MKKFTLLVFLFACGFSYAQYTTNAPWMSEARAAKTTDQTLTFNEIVEAFDSYWENKNHKVKGSGYKPFKRWEHHWQNYLKADGTILTTQEIWALWEQKNSLRLANETEDVSDWQTVGPVTHTNTGSWSSGQGRVNAIEVDPNNSNIYYAGAPAGGIWKSIDAGENWEPLTDDLPQIGISAIAVDPADSDVIYIGTGDEDANDTYSIGILKSIDGGATWQTTGLTFTNTYSHVSEIYVNPSDPNIIYAATSAGFYKSDNAGDTFTMTYSGNVRDIKLKPGDPTVIYAATSNQVYKSSNSGASFSLASTGLPTNAGRQVLAVTPAAPDNVYVLSAGTSYGFQGVYKSTNNAVSFTRVDNGEDIFQSTQAWYDMAFDVSKTDENVMYAGVLNVWKSTNGGQTFSQWNNWSSPFGSTYTHADIHMIRFFGDTLFFGTDGGFYRSTDGTTSTDLTAGLAIGQFYKIAVAAQSSGNMVGGLQDNGGYAYSDNNWKNFYGADGMDTAIDPANPNKYYGFIQNGGGLYFSNDAGTSLAGSINGPETENGNWVTPLMINQEGELYAGYSRLYKLTGGSFTAVSPNLGLIDAMEIDPTNSDNMYVAVNNQLKKSTDRGISFPSTYSFPANITSIAVNSSDNNIIYVTTSGYNGKVYRSLDGGVNFTDISFNLPNEPKLVVKHQGQDPLNPIYLGTILGVYRFDDSADVWEVFGNNLPNVPVRDLEINILDQNITAATYGRGIWRSSITVQLADNDIRILGINSVDAQINCGNFSPTIEVNNNGNNAITAFDVIYTVDGGTPETISWTGTLNSMENTSIGLPDLALQRGAHTLEVALDFENDTYPTNNNAAREFYLNDMGMDNQVNTFEAETDELIVVDPNPASPLWERGVPSGTILNSTSSGSNAYATNLDGNHPNNIVSYLVSQCYDLTSIQDPVLNFEMAFDLEYQWDIIYMEYSTDGNNWQLLGSANDPDWYNNAAVPTTDCYNCPGAQWTGTVANMQSYFYSLNNFNSETNFMVRFVFVADEAVNQEGVVIDDFVIKSFLSVKENVLEQALSVYPNPSSDIFNIQLHNSIEDVEISVSDITGKRIFSNKKVTNGFELDLSNFSTGIYLLQVQSGSTIVTKKLMKK